MSDRCDFSGMDKRYCSHCLKKQRGTQENPVFSILTGHYAGSPVVEILKNGGPVTRHDEHFRFGCVKARMILACLPALKRFGWPSWDDDRSKFETQVFRDGSLGLTVEVSVAMNPNFRLSDTDELVEKYWLDLRALPSLETHKGLGVMKCRAVWTVQDELRAWVFRHCQ
jgi:hypothetical protein